MLTFILVVNVHLPKDRISMAHQGYGFCEFLTEEDAEYACKIMNQIKLWGKPIRVNKVRMCHHLSERLLLTNSPGLFRQKATRRWRELVHWEFGRERGRETVVRHVQLVWNACQHGEGAC